MMINTDNMVPISTANQNFSKVARMVDENGSVIIMKNNAPRYVLIEFSQLEKYQNASPEEVDALAEQIMSENDAVFKELAK